MIDYYRIVKTYLLSVSSYETLTQRHPHPVNEFQKRRFLDMVKRLEEGLFKLAHTKVSFHLCLFIFPLLFI